MPAMPSQTMTKQKSKLDFPYPLAEAVREKNII